MNLLPTILALVLVVPAVRAAADGADDSPWAAGRDFQTFAWLVERSPFSLPTAEESSPLADRFALTGAAGIGGEALVFVFDRTTQARHMLSKQPNAESMSLVEFLPDPDPRRMRATIRVGGEIATISFQEAGAASPDGQSPAGAPLPQPGQPPATTAVNPSATINAPGGDPSTNPPRKVIRRRIITGQ